MSEHRPRPRAFRLDDERGRRRRRTSAPPAPTATIRSQTAAIAETGCACSFSQLEPYGVAGLDRLAHDRLFGKVWVDRTVMFCGTPSSLRPAL